MATVSFVWDQSVLKMFEGQKIDSAVKAAVRKSGHEALRGMRTASIRAIRERKRMKYGKLLKHLPLIFPRGSGDLKSLAWTMRVNGEFMPVSAFPNRQTKKGVTVEINKGARTLIKGAFRATMSNGHEGIFRRQGKKRLPISEAFTTRTVDVFRDHGMLDQQYDNAQEVFKNAFARLLPVELDRLQKRKRRRVTFGPR